MSYPHILAFAVLLGIVHVASAESSPNAAVHSSRRNNDAVIPVLEFRDALPSDVLEFLLSEVVRPTPLPRKGASIGLIEPPRIEQGRPPILNKDHPAWKGLPPLTLTFHSITAREALDRIARELHLTYEVAGSNALLRTKDGQVLTLGAPPADLDPVERIRQAERLASAGEYGTSVRLLVEILPSLSNHVHECRAKARLASYLYETGEFEKSMLLCTEVVDRWPRGSAGFSPLMLRADCLTALGKTNEAVRAYRVHYNLHAPDTRVTDDQIAERMRSIRAKTEPARRYGVP